MRGRDARARYASTWTMALAVLALVAGCGARPGVRALGVDESPSSPAVALARRAEIARASLGYASALAGERYLLSVELGSHFELVVRELAGPKQSQERARIALGRSEYDIAHLAVDPARGRVFVASMDGRVRGYDIGSGQPLVTWHLGSPVTAVAVAPAEELVVMGTADGILCVRRYRDGALLQCALAHDDRISALAVHAAGQELASASWTGEVVRWRLPSLTEIDRRSFPGSVCALAYAPRDRRLAIARSAFPPVRSPDIAARERRAQATGPAAGHAISIWSPDTGPEPEMLGHAGPVTSVAWTPDGQRLATGSWDRSIALWDVTDGRQLSRLTGFAGLVRDVAIDDAGRHLAVAAWTDGRTGGSVVLVDLLYRTALDAGHAVGPHR